MDAVIPWRRQAGASESGVETAALLRAPVMYKAILGVRSLETALTRRSGFDPKGQSTSMPLACAVPDTALVFGPEGRSAASSRRQGKRRETRRTPKDSHFQQYFR